MSRFGITRVLFAHPCGIEHELVESPADGRAPITNDLEGVGPVQGIRGTYGAAVAVFDRTAMDDFRTIALGMTKEVDSDEGLMFSVPNDGGPSSMVEVLHQPTGPQGSWTLSGGAIHHLALNTGNEENQLKLKAHIEGLGFTDVSDQKDRNYFKSCYVRSPGEALFEISWSDLRPGPGESLPIPEAGRWTVSPDWNSDDPQIAVPAGRTET